MDRYNAAGYSDPTAYSALSAIERAEKARRYLPLVYIASPYAGDTERNTERARGYCRFALGKGCIPLAPHLLYPQFMDDDDRQSRELGLSFALVLLGKCEELWVFGEHLSSGMEHEIAKARKRGIPVRYWNSRCEEVMAHGQSR